MVDVSLCVLNKTWILDTGQYGLHLILPIIVTNIEVEIGVSIMKNSQTASPNITNVRMTKKLYRVANRTLLDSLQDSDPLSPNT
jgi:hypothetical protein